MSTAASCIPQEVVELDLKFKVAFSIISMFAVDVHTLQCLWVHRDRFLRVFGLYFVK